MAAAKQGQAALSKHLVTRLAVRRAEIEADVHARIQAISDSSRTPDDPAYIEGLQAAVPAALDFALDGLEEQVGDRPLIPVILLAQARLAARSGVALDTVLRRYVAGFTLLNDILMQEAAVGSYSPAALSRLMRNQAARFDRLLATITDEYRHQLTCHPSSTDKRRVRRIEDLLAGGLVASDDLEYDFGHTHIGIVAIGAGGVEALRGLANALDHRLLLVHPDEAIVWAWLGAVGEIDAERTCVAAAGFTGADSLLAIGEPAQGLRGWRLTHRQARAAAGVARRRSSCVTRYADVAVLASALQDDLLATSLRRLYLDPLETARNGGGTLRETLRAYLATGQNLTSAAASLGVNRGTVTYRLQAIEQRLGRTIPSCLVGLAAALEIADIGHRPANGT